MSDILMECVFLKNTNLFIHLDRFFYGEITLFVIV